MRSFLKMTLVAAGVCGALPMAWGQGQVNGTGATLFVDFFKVPAAYNDFIDVDGDGNFGPSTPGDPADLLINPDPAQFGNFGPALSQTWWLMQYRSVGSVQGYREFVAYQVCGDLPEDVPSEAGLINSDEFADLGVITWVGPPSGCHDDTDGDGIDNASGTPVCPDSMDFATSDVPTPWATQGPSGTPAWNRTPASAGYGQNANLSNGDASQFGYPNLLAALSNDCDGSGTIDPNESLNTNVDTPDNRTVFDTRLAYVPVALLGNRGLDIDHLGFTEIEHAFVTGRLPSGLNVAAATRDVGSGTRNAFANSVGIDPSWCVGDHIGMRINDATDTNLGPHHQINNCGGSGIMEDAVQNRRLAIGFTGLFGGSRAIADAEANKYEILGVIKDIDSDGDSHVDATQVVRPSIDNVLFNSDPNTGYQIGGTETIATVGNPNANRATNDPLYEGSIPVSNGNAAAFINNIVSSIAQFTDPNDPNQITDQTAMPGELLALQFTLEASVDATPLPTDPKLYQANPRFNGTLQAFTAANTAVPPTPAYGSMGSGRVPTRTSNPVFGDPNNPTATAYSDGSVNGNYLNYFTDDANSPSIVGGGSLNSRNAVAGDFNGDGHRGNDDVVGLMAAIDDPAGYATTVVGSSMANPLVPEIVGDFNGDGNLDVEDARYFADGLAIDSGSGRLNRALGFELVDAGNLAATGTLNTFGTTLATGKAYEAGDSRGDVAGNTRGAALVTPGASPTGHDGVVDATDIAYVCANFGDWTDLDQAAAMDLSCDMNGDLLVDADDVATIVEDILGTHLGDANLDGAVNITDLGVVLQDFGQAGGWAAGDFNCDGAVNITDLGVVLQNFGS